MGDFGGARFGKASRRRAASTSERKRGRSWPMALSQVHEHASFFCALVVAVSLVFVVLFFLLRRQDGRTHPPTHTDNTHPSGAASSWPSPLATRQAAQAAQAAGAGASYFLFFLFFSGRARAFEQVGSSDHANTTGRHATPSTQQKNNNGVTGRGSVRQRPSHLGAAHVLMSGGRGVGCGWLASCVHALTGLAESGGYACGVSV